MRVISSGWLNREVWREDRWWEGQACVVGKLTTRRNRARRGVFSSAYQPYQCCRSFGDQVRRKKEAIERRRGASQHKVWLLAPRKERLCYAEVGMMMEIGASTTMVRPSALARTIQLAQQPMPPNKQCRAPRPTTTPCISASCGSLSERSHIACPKGARFGTFFAESLLLWLLWVTTTPLLMPAAEKIQSCCFLTHTAMTAEA